MKSKRAVSLLVSALVLSACSAPCFSAYAAEPVYKESSVIAFDKDSTWTTDTKIDLFDRNELGNQIMYPGVKGSYSFTVRNMSASGKDCEVIIEDANDFKIPLDIRIKKDGAYVLGSEDSWVNSASYDSGIFNLSPDKESIYDLEWKWDYYTSDDNDVRDTELGMNERYEVQPYYLKIQAYAEAEVIEISEPESSAPDESSEQESSEPESSTPDSSEPDESSEPESPAPSGDTDTSDSDISNGHMTGIADTSPVDPDNGGNWSVITGDASMLVAGAFLITAIISSVIILLTSKRRKDGE